MSNRHVFPAIYFVVRLTWPHVIVMNCKRKLSEDRKNKTASFISQSEVYCFITYNRNYININKYRSCRYHTVSFKNGRTDMVRWHDSKEHRRQLFCSCSPPPGSSPPESQLKVRWADPWSVWNQNGQLRPEGLECVREMTSWHLPAFLLLTTGGRLSQPNKQTDQSKTCQTKGIIMKYWGFVNKIYLQWICTYYLLLAQKGNCNWRGGTVFICFITNGLTIQDRPFRSSSGALPVHGHCSQTALGRTNHSGKRSGQQVPKVHWK